MIQTEINDLHGAQWDVSTGKGGFYWEMFLLGNVSVGQMFQLD